MADKKVTLISIPTSPWSLKARWALAACDVPFNSQLYAPIIGEPMLRYKLGRWSGRVTVPVLLIPGEKELMDSAAIAKYGDDHSNNKNVRLFPEGRDVDAWVRRSEEVLEISRRWMIEKVRGSPAASQEYLPKFMQGIWGVSGPIAAAGFVLFVNKYSDLGGGGKEKVEQHLNALREALKASSSGYIFESFSFADIAMASAFQLLYPVADEYVKYGPEVRKVLQDEAFHTQWPDLIEWRDKVFANHHYNAAKLKAKAAAQE